MSRPAAATRAPSSIGALAAALQILPLEAALHDDDVSARYGREVHCDACGRRMVETHFDRNPACRFDHETWHVEPAGGLTISQALALGGTTASLALGVPGGFATHVTCVVCARRTRRIVARRALGRRRPYCRACHGALFASPLDCTDALRADDLSKAERALPLSRLGLRAGDVFFVAGPAARVQRHYYDWLGWPRGPQNTAVVAGCGTIGSPLISHLARAENVGRLVLVDPDIYEPHNLAGQAIAARDVGVSKVRVQARIACAIRPSLEVVMLPVRIEDVPLGYLHDAAVAGCVDSRGARQAINEAAWRVARCWVDAGVDGAALLARVVAYRPGRNRTCLECPWDEADYAALEQRVPCADARRASPAPLRDRAHNPPARAPRSRRSDSNAPAAAHAQSVRRTKTTTGHPNRRARPKHRGHLAHSCSTRGASRARSKRHIGKRGTSK